MSNAWTELPELPSSGSDCASCAVGAGIAIETAHALRSPSRGGIIVTTAPTETLAAQIERCFRTVDFEPLRDLYHPDAVLDAAVPQGRFHGQGPERIVAWYQDAYSQFDNPRCTWLRITTAQALVLVEWELRDGETDSARLIRQIDVIRTNGDRIIEQTHYCPGVWDAATTTQQRPEAPMIGVSSATPVVVVGAGQAGLAVSHELTARGIDHVVLERARVGQTWRGLWDSFCLVTPNWTMSLPGSPYAGDDPEGFVPRDEVVKYLQRYASSFDAPVREGVGVDSLEPGPKGGFLLRTSAGDMQAESVVVCTGAYQRPHRPDVAAAFPQEVLVIDAADYRNPGALPPGRVLVVGSGQTGCQISEELHEAGRDVFLACGRAPWTPRRADGHDIVTWLQQTTFFDMPLSALPTPAARLVANLQATGHRGGHDLHYRTLQAMGVQLLGRLTGVKGHRAHFAGDLADSVAFGDARYADIRQLLTEQLTAKGMMVPELPDPPPFHADPPLELDLQGVGVVIFTSGFRPGYAHWVRFPAFDAMGFPLTNNGASTVVPGLFFCGVHFLRKRKSAVLYGVGEDAAIVAHSIARNRSQHPTAAY